MVSHFLSVVKRSRFSGSLDIARKVVEVANRPIASARIYLDDPVGSEEPLASAHPELRGLEGRMDEEATVQLIMEATKPRVA